MRSYTIQVFFLSRANCLHSRYSKLVGNISFKFNDRNHVSRLALVNISVLPIISFLYLWRSYSSLLLTLRKRLHLVIFCNLAIGFQMRGSLLDCCLCAFLLYRCIFNCSWLRAVHLYSAKKRFILDSLLMTLDWMLWSNSSTLLTLEILFFFLVAYSQVSLISGPDAIRFVRFGCTKGACIFLPVIFSCFDWMSFASGSLQKAGLEADAVNFLDRFVIFGAPHDICHDTPWTTALLLLNGMV